MKRFLSLLLLCSAFVLSMQAQRVSVEFRNVSLSEAFRRLNAKTTRYHISFIYNELEDYIITTTVTRKKVPDAVRQLVGLYPISVHVSGDDIVVEPQQRTALRYKGRVADEAGRPLAFASVALLSVADSTVLDGGITNEAGCFVIPCNARKVLARVSFLGYKTAVRPYHTPDVGTISLHPDTTALKGVVVEGLRQAVTYKAGRIIYDVDADSSAQHEKAIETLRKMPGLMVSRKGDISHDFDKTIVYKINGLSDPLAANPTQLMEALDSKYLKRFELITQPGMQYGANTVVLNIVTKGRLEGYLADLNSEATDSKWFKSAWATTKVKRLRLSPCYSHLWNWDHASTSHFDVTRLASTSDYLTVEDSRNGGLRRHFNNVELSVSYDVDDHSLLSAYGRALWAHGHSDSWQTRTVTQPDGSLSYHYLRRSHYKMESPEYYANLSFERFFGKDGDDGKFFAGYDFYGRSIESTQRKAYKEIDSVAGAANAISDLHDYITTNNSGGDWHTVEVDYERRLAKRHRILLYAKGLLRLDHDDERVSWTPTGQDDYTFDENASNRYKRTQTLLTPMAYYTYSTDKFLINAGAGMELDHEHINRHSMGYKFNNTFCNVLPSVSLSYEFSPRWSMEAGWSMSVSRPSVDALDPYVDSTNVNEHYYGNTHLKPQRNQQVAIGTSFSLGKRDPWNLSLGLTYVYSDRLILNYSFLEGDIFHSTKDNIGHKEDLQMQLSLRKRFGPFFMRVVPYLSFASFNASRIGQENDGWFFKVNGMAELELPKDFYLETSGSYHTRYIYLQGTGSEGYSYGLTLTKKLLRNHLTLTASASSFLPVHYTGHSHTEFDGYVRNSSNRYWNASFQLVVRYTFGKLKARVRNTEHTIENNDIKTDYDE